MIQTKAGEIDSHRPSCYNWSMKNDKPTGNRIMDVAYIRDGRVTHFDESLILACLLHTKGKGRGTKDMTDVQRIMKDKNLELPK